MLKEKEKKGNPFTISQMFLQLFKKEHHHTVVVRSQVQQQLVRSMPIVSDTDGAEMFVLNQFQNHNRCPTPPWQLSSHWVWNVASRTQETMRAGAHMHISMHRWSNWLLEQ